MFTVIQRLFLQQTNPLNPTTKYLLWSGISFWAAKTLRFSLRASVVCVSKVRVFKHREQRLPRYLSK